MADRSKATDQVDSEKDEVDGAKRPTLDEYADFFIAYATIPGRQFSTAELVRLHNDFYCVRWSVKHYSLTLTAETSPKLTCTLLDNNNSSSSSSNNNNNKK